MQASYIVHSGTTVQVTKLDTNVVSFQVSIRAAAGVTVKGALEDPDDSTAWNTYSPASSTTPGPQWQTLPAAVNGVITLTTPYSALQWTPTTGGTSTVLQQGLR